MFKYIKNFKVSYSFPLEYPVKVVINRLGLLGLVGWLYQKYAQSATWKDVVLSERILEVPIFHEWFGKFFSDSTEYNILEIGHVASHVSLELANIGYKITGVDLREYPFHHKNLLSIQCDFLKQNFNQKFDCIYSLSTIEHFGISKRYGGEDMADNNLDEDAFEKISQLLKENGKVILSFPFAKAFVPGIWFRVYTRNDLRKKIEKYFHIVEDRYYGRKDKEWFRIIDPNSDPSSPHDGVALFLLLKK